jgi:general stress protein YciG
MPRDQRTYITVHDGMPEHPKVEPLSDAAFRLLVTTWCWCSRQLTDGQVPSAVWLKRGTAKTRAELRNAGLVEDTPGGVLMHDYTEHQRTADEVAELREKRAEAGRKGGLAKAAAQATASKPVASASPVAKQTASKPLAESETDTDTDKSNPPGGGQAAAESTQHLIARWIDHQERRPPGAVIGQVSKQLKAMLNEGIPITDLEFGLAAWQAKGLHPSTLPSVVHEMRTARPQTPRRQQETDDLFDRALRRNGVTSPVVDQKALGA